VQRQIVPELRVEAPDSFAAVAARVRTLAPAVLERLMQLVGVVDPGAPITIVLATEDLELARQTPRWIAGFARANEGLIVIFPARSLSYPYDSLDDVVRHEIAHVLIARAAGGRPVPRWFHEGLALVAERSWGVEDRTRVALALTGQRWSTVEVDAAFDGGGRKTSAAYAVSGALVRELMRRQGVEAPARILARLAAGERFEAAFVAVTNETVPSYEDRFWRTGWWSDVLSFLTSSVLLWLVVTFLGVYAIRTRRARNAARRRLWDE
jgi:hypothetical protein